MTSWMFTCQRCKGRSRQTGFSYFQDPFFCIVLNTRNDKQHPMFLFIRKITDGRELDQYSKDLPPNSVTLGKSCHVPHYVFSSVKHGARIQSLLRPHTELRFWDSMIFSSSPNILCWFFRKNSLERKFFSLFFLFLVLIRKRT